jgi:hypothetical protein
MLFPVAMAGCARDPGPALCPDVAPGELVITEFRGPQDPDDGSKPWVEIYNASDGVVDLIGTRVRFRKLDDSGENAIIVRRSLTFGGGEYVVLGLNLDDNLPTGVDYGFAGDYKESWLSSSAVQIDSCGEKIDRADYANLPDIGSYSLGTNPPPADANDFATAWCNNGTALGTPGQPNPVCP